MSAKTNDTLFLAAAGVVFAGACVWAILLQSKISESRLPSLAPSSGMIYESSTITLATLESKQWDDMPHQSAGPEWIFDVFTPPQIFYNEITGKFTPVPPVISPVGPVGPVGPVIPTPPPSFGLELVKVTQPLFRLQLLTYVGQGPSARGTFENQITGEVIFATSGKKLPSLNLEIVKFSAEVRRTPVEGGTEIVDTVATALVRDTVTGVETVLDVKERTPEGPAVVTFKDEFTGALITAQAGETLTAGGYTFEVGELSQRPPEAVVTKNGGDMIAPEVKTLGIPPPPPPPSREGVPPSPDGAFPGAVPPAPGGFPGF